MINQTLVLNEIDSYNAGAEICLGLNRSGILSSTYIDQLKLSSERKFQNEWVNLAPYIPCLIFISSPMLFGSYFLTQIAKEAKRNRVGIYICLDNYDGAPGWFSEGSICFSSKPSDPSRDWNKLIELTRKFVILDPKLHQMTLEKHLGYGPTNKKVIV